MSRKLVTYQIRWNLSVCMNCSRPSVKVGLAPSAQPVGEFKLLTGVFLVHVHYPSPIQASWPSQAERGPCSLCRVKVLLLETNSSLPTVPTNSLQVVIPSDLPSTRPCDVQARPMEVLQCSVKGISWWTIHSLFINQFEELGRGPFRRRLGQPKSLNGHEFLS
jgi:hypothetical protein